MPSPRSRSYTALFGSAGEEAMTIPEWFLADPGRSTLMPQERSNSDKCSALARTVSSTQCRPSYITSPVEAPMPASAARGAVHALAPSWSVA